MWNYEAQRKKAERTAQIKREKAELYAIKHQYDEPKEKVSTSKKLVIFALVDCVVIQLFSMFAMLYLGDISAIYSLIAIVGSILAEVLSLASYNHKSMKENTEGGINYQDMMNNFEENNADLIMGLRNGGRNGSKDRSCGER